MSYVKLYRSLLIVTSKSKWPRSQNQAVGQALGGIGEQWWQGRHPPLNNPTASKWIQLDSTGWFSKFLYHSTTQLVDSLRLEGQFFFGRAPHLLQLHGRHLPAWTLVPICPWIKFRAKWEVYLENPCGFVVLIHCVWLRIVRASADTIKINKDQ